eukprot:7722375-Lingulodinium_polyedra.AAC.1
MPIPDGRVAGVARGGRKVCPVVGHGGPLFLATSEAAPRGQRPILIAAAGNELFSRIAWDLWRA